MSDAVAPRSSGSVKASGSASARALLASMAALLGLGWAAHAEAKDYGILDEVIESRSIVDNSGPITAVGA